MPEGLAERPLGICPAYWICRRSVSTTVIWLSILAGVIGSNAANAQNSTFAAIRNDVQVQRGLLISGMLGGDREEAGKTALRQALTRYRLIYQNGERQSAADEIARIKGFSEMAARDFGFTIDRTQAGRATLVPQKLLPEAKHTDKNRQSFYRSVACCVTLYTYRWDLQRNPPQEMFQKTLLRVTNATYHYVRQSNHGFAARLRSLRRLRNGTTFVRHQVQQAFVSGGKLVGSYFSFLDTPMSGFETPAYLEPQIAFWRASLPDLVTTPHEDRDQAIKTWVKTAGLTDQHAEDIKKLDPASFASDSSAIDELMTRWAWRKAMSGLANIILNQFRQDNLTSSISVSSCQVHRPKQPGVRDVRIVFATNREATGELAKGAGNARSWFKASPDKTNILNVGCAMLSVPTDEAALIGLRTQFRNHWLSGEVKEPINDRAFYRVIKARPLGTRTAGTTRHRLRIKDREAIWFPKEDRALIFVHGYNSSFGGSLLRIAQIAASTKYPGRIYFFSWPSAGTYTGYVSDMDSAERSELHLTGFLRAILLDPELKKIDIVAHSMGSQMVLRALTDLSNIFLSRDDIRLGELIFAAPDLSVTVFEEKIRDIGYLADGVTVYASRKDKALLISRLARGQKSRLGSVTGKAAPSIEKVRYFDATSPNNICNGWGYLDLEHNYFSENATVLNHITEVLTKAHGASSQPPSGSQLVKKIASDRFKLVLPAKKCLLSRLLKRP